MAKTHLRPSLWIISIVLKINFSITARLAAPLRQRTLGQRPILVELAGLAKLAAEDDIRAQA